MLWAASGGLVSSEESWQRGNEELGFMVVRFRFWFRFYVLDFF